MTPGEIKTALLAALESDVERIAANLATCPAPGNAEVHARWLPSMTMALAKGFAPSQECAIMLVERCMSRAPSPESEVKSAMVSAARKLGIRTSGNPGSGNKGSKLSPPRVSRDWATILEIGQTGPTLSDLSSSSPGTLDFESEADIAPFFLQRLFAPAELVCIGSKLESAKTRRLAEWLGNLDEGQFLVPSPMSKPMGQKADGGASVRCNDNTANRRFLVLDFDFDPTKSPECAAMLAELRVTTNRNGKDLCAALGMRLAVSTGRSPTLVVDTAGKSLHFWFRVEGEPETKIHTFLSSAIRLGADPALWTPCQFARLPGGIREHNKKRQRVVYWNPDALPTDNETV